MADNHLRQSAKSDEDTEGSLTESDVDVDVQNLNESENSKDTPIKDTSGKVAEGSGYESAEETNEKVSAKDMPEEKCDEVQQQEPEPEDSGQELVDEEGGEEGIAEADETDLLSCDAQEGDSEDGEYVEEERQQGDGEECSPTDALNEKELDFDEDRRNPQYIPKKGVFYEHDDRNNEELKEKEEEPPRDRKKKLWLDEGKWGHDRFREEEQFPKSKNELIEVYGYDIRNEDGPPRARRRRRYGRGPSKYERNWEDSSAYGREKFRSPPTNLVRSRRGIGRFRGQARFRGRGRGPHPFNAAYHEKSNKNDYDENENEHSEHEEQTEKDENAPVINSSEFPALPSKELVSLIEISSAETNFETPPSVQEQKSVRTITFENSNYCFHNSVETEVEQHPPHRGKTSIYGNNYERGNRRPATRGGRGPGRGEYNRRGRGGMRHISPRFLENKINKVNTDMERLSLVDEENNEISPIIAQPIENNNECEEILPPGNEELQNMTLKGDTSGRPKRYSSLRQRSLPDTNNYQVPPPSVQPSHSPYCEPGYQTALYAQNETCVPSVSTQSQPATSTPIINRPAYSYPQTYIENFASLRMPVTTAPQRLFPQVTVAAPQPLMPPPPCITPAPNLMSYAAPPPPTGYHQFAAYPQYATPPPPPPPAPPSEMYQPGITYYYPPTQPPPIRPTVQKRPKAAIPILPPPERESKKKECNQPSSTLSYTSEPSDPKNVEVSSLRTESSSQLQPTVGVES